VNWILKDPDVHTFYFDLVGTYADVLDSDDVNSLWTELGEYDDENDNW
jgi:hypothetical protein